MGTYGFRQVISGCDHALTRWKQTQDLFSTGLKDTVDAGATMDGVSEHTPPTMRKSVGQQHKEVHHVRTDGWAKSPHAEGDST